MHLRSHGVRNQFGSETNMTNPVTLTAEQFELLMQRMSTNAISTTATSGNFSKCNSRFSGTKGEDCEAFIDAISIYKDCLNITDDNALKGLPMLLDGLAATWWQGLKSSVLKWTDAIDSLRHSFGYNKPAHKIFRELFSREQGDKEPTDIFVSNARALLAKLPSTPLLADSHKLDMVYGLLSRRIRHRLARDSVNSFSDLIEKARNIEESFQENTATSIPAKSLMVEEKRHRPKCQFCQNFGHTQSECRKFATSKPRGPVAEQASKSSIVCFGCGNPGYIRSQCPRCKSSANSPSDFKPKPGSSTLSNNPVASVDLLSTDMPSVSISRPLLFISVLGKSGLAYMDSGARCSIAGHKLYSHLKSINTPFTSTVTQMILADGQRRQVDAEIFNCEVIVEHKRIPTTFFAIPSHVESKTLLGIDFISKAEIILNASKRCWYFEDDPAQKFELIPEPEFIQTSNNISEPNNSVIEDLTPSDSIVESLTTSVIPTTETILLLREDEATGLNEFETSRLEDLISSHPQIFGKSQELTPYAEHTIPVTDDTPIAVPPYRMTPVKKEILRKELDKLLDDNVIEECESAYAAPVVLVPKSDGSHRLCVDYRRLNEVTISVKYPLPRIDDLLHSTSNANFITTLDLKAGYHQIPVKRQDQDKTSFITPFGTFRYKSMPFGLKTAPATFQRLIDRFRSGLQHIAILAYLDDLIIISSDFDTHLRDLNDVFTRLRLFKLHVNRTKCSFCCTKVKYLGHIVSKEGLQPDPGKISAISKMPVPLNPKQLLGFLQTCSWFRKFVPNFASVAKPLTDLTRKNAKWQWTSSQREAFATLKDLLTTSPILRQADPSQPFILRTDASSYALGAALLQGEGADEKPIEYASTLLTPAQRNYHTTEREALAVVWAVEKFRGYLEGSSVVVKSDHQPLRWLMSLKSPAGRLARWALTLQPYDLKIEYIPGRSNVIADTLSRPPCHDAEVSKCEICTITLKIPSDSPSELRSQQLTDPDISEIIKCFENPAVFDSETRRWSDRGYLMLNGVLYRYSPDSDGDEAQLVVPKCLVETILTENHDSPLAGHNGVDRTLQRIIPKYYWTGMRRQVTEYVARCIDCQRYKASNLKPSGLLQTPIQSQRFEVLSIDLFGPLPETPTGERWIFIIEDTSSRWTEIFPLRVATAEACARCLIDEVILRYGTPRKVISDNGVQFVSEVMQHVSLVLGFKQNLIPVHHPAANPCERKNRDLKTQLAILTADSHTNWKDKIPAVRFAMNTSKCQSTGYTPAFLTFGRELSTPDNVRRDLRAIIENDNFVPQITPYLRTLAATLSQARENHERSQDQRKRYADRSRRDDSFAIGDLVLVTSFALSQAKSGFTSKFAPKRDGPYKISRKISPVSYEIVHQENPTEPAGIYHVSALRRYVYPSEDTPVPSPVLPLRRRGRPPITKPVIGPQESANPPRPRRGRPKKQISSLGPHSGR